jgi:pyruvate,water dikinase
LAKIDAYAREYGYKTLHCHEFMYKQWIEDVTPIVESIRGYLAADYDFPAAHRAAKEDQAAAVKELRSLVPDTASPEQRAKLDHTLELVLRLMPLTPDHHFYLDQGTNARMRLLLLAIGRKMVEAGLLGDPEDVFFLEYDQLRWYAGNPKTAENPGGYDGRSIVRQARRARDAAWRVRPRDWVGTVSHWSLYEEPYRILWGYPDRFLKAAEKAAEPKEIVKGFGAAPGLAEGTARVVRGFEDFESVKPGEIMVAVMTNPAWVVLFTKVAGVVCDAGGVLAHPAVVAREFGIPAVVGTVNATQRIGSGDRIRVNGVTGTVEVLERAAGG